MRDFLDAILSFIGASSLTDDEFESIELENTNDQVANYNALHTILEDREAVSATLSRLEYYFSAKGVSVSEADSASSNIFVGAPLDDDD
jgi:hypothetical protein